MHRAQSSSLWRLMSLLLAYLFTAATADIIPFPYPLRDGSFGNPVDAEEGFGNSSPISDACKVALNKTITSCSPNLQLESAVGYYSTPNDAGLCAAGCNASLAAYRTGVLSACGTTSAFDGYPNSWRGDLISEYFNIVCAKDPSSGQYCVGKFTHWLRDQKVNLTDLELLKLPNAVLCSSCQLSYLQTVSKSAFLGYNDASVSTYQNITARCQVALSMTPSQPPADFFPNGINSTDIAPFVCASGQNYTIKAGDTCRSIAAAKSVAEGTLASINNLFADCSAMANDALVGATLCLPKMCQTYTMDVGDDCYGVSAFYNLTLAQFSAYNPSVTTNCGNLVNATGAVVCVTSPDGAYNPTVVPGGDQQDQGAGEYGLEAVPAPGPTPFLTTPNCGRYYKVQVADTCNRVSVSSHVRVELFKAINPSIDADCFNLVPDLWYCVRPVSGWNVTDANGPNPVSSQTVAAPGPTQTGTTGACYTWHVVVSDDTCFGLQQTTGVTMQQLVAWNANLKADCSNLELGIAYCVRGPALPSSSSTTRITTTTKTTTASISTRTSSTSTSQSATPTSVPCAFHYTVSSGDWCAKIWEAYGLSESQFRALNPIIDASCNINIGQSVCVAPGPATGGACTKTYRVVSGDWCSKIWDAQGLTEAKFRQLNPGINVNCDLSIGQVLCVAQ